MLRLGASELVCYEFHVLYNLGMLDVVSSQNYDGENAVDVCDVDLVEKRKAAVRARFY